MASVSETQLWALIQRAKDEHGISYRDLPALSNGRLRRTDLDRYRLNAIRHIVPEKLIAISETFRIPLPTLVDAALATMGLEAARSGSVEDAIRRDDSLDELLKRRLLRMIEEYRSQPEEPGEEQTAAYDPNFPTGPTDNTP